MSLPDPIASGVSGAKLFITVAVLLVLFGIIGYLAYTKSRVETQLAQAQTDITALTAANENWKTTTDQANSALAAEVAAEKLREQQAATAVAGAQKVADEDTKEAADIMAQKMPPADSITITGGTVSGTMDASGHGFAYPTGSGGFPSDPQCDAAKKLMKTYFGAKK